MIKTFIAGAVAGTALAFSGAVESQICPQGVPYDKLASSLSSEYNETTKFKGIINRRSPMAFELFSNNETGSWSWVMVNPSQGMACIQMSGSDHKYSEGMTNEKPAPRSELEKKYGIKPEGPQV